MVTAALPERRTDCSNLECPFIRTARFALKGEIMASNPVTNPGIKVSFNNTPQAADDLFTTGQTLLTEDNLGSRGSFKLNVMANDAGGNAKSLYSIDDGINSAGSNGDLLTQD